MRRRSNAGDIYRLTDVFREPPAWDQLARAAEFNPRKLAKLCNVSRATLREHFAREYGLDFNQWIEFARASAAGGKVGLRRTTGFNRRIDKGEVVLPRL